MIPGPANILTCPYCGGKKDVMSLMSGNTCGATVWSDTRRDYPMLPEVSPIQKCPHCGRYFFIEQAKSAYDKGKESFELGKLNYHEIKEAIEQMNRLTLTSMQRWAFNHEFLMIYNDSFRRHPEMVAFPPSEEDEKLFVKVINDLLEGTEDAPDYELFRAELLRESQRFDEASAVLSCHLNEDDKWVVAAMQKHIAANDPFPFLLIKDGNQVC